MEREGKGGRGGGRQERGGGGDAAGQVEVEGGRGGVWVKSWRLRWWVEQEEDDGGKGGRGEVGSRWGSRR